MGCAKEVVMRRWGIPRVVAVSVCFCWWWWKDLPSRMPLRERLNSFSASAPRTLEIVLGVERLWVARSTVGEGAGEMLRRRWGFFLGLDLDFGGGWGLGAGIVLCLLSKTNVQASLLSRQVLQGPS